MFNGLAVARAKAAAFSRKILLDNRLPLASDDYLDHPRLLRQICRKIGG
jgi:hypothetical protein